MLTEYGSVPPDTDISILPGVLHATGAIIIGCILIVSGIIISTESTTPAQLFASVNVTYNIPSPKFDISKKFACVGVNPD